MASVDHNSGYGLYSHLGGSNGGSPSATYGTENGSTSGLSPSLAASRGLVFGAFATDQSSTLPRGSTRPRMELDPAVTGIDYHNDTAGSPTDDLQVEGANGSDGDDLQTGSLGDEAADRSGTYEIAAGSSGKMTGKRVKEKKDSEEQVRMRKDNHKEVERRRRETINDGINELKKIVPGCEKNKGSILKQAVQYIQQLKDNEASNIEKWTLEKLLTEQSLREMNDRETELVKRMTEAEGRWQDAERENGIFRDELERLGEKPDKLLLAHERDSERERVKTTTSTTLDTDLSAHAYDDLASLAQVGHRSTSTSTTRSGSKRGEGPGSSGKRKLADTDTLASTEGKRVRL